MLPEEFTHSKETQFVVQEMGEVIIKSKNLVEALHKGEYYNEADYGAMSTFTAILGREAAILARNQADELMKKGRDYAPGIDDYTWETPPVVPGAMENILCRLLGLSSFCIDQWF